MFETERVFALRCDWPGGQTSLLYDCMASVFLLYFERREGLRLDVIGQEDRLGSSMIGQRFSNQKSPRNSKFYLRISVL